MKITRRQLRQIIRESMNSTSELHDWAKSVGLPIDIDPLTGEELILVSDEFAMEQGLPDGTGWGVERSADDEGWIVTSSPDYSAGSKEIASGDLSDLDSIGIEQRGY